MARGQGIAASGTGLLFGARSAPVVKPPVPDADALKHMEQGGEISLETERISLDTWTYFIAKQVWRNNQGEIHRVNGPALVGTSSDGGNELWFLNGKLHRDDGPAKTTKFIEIWYQKGKVHRDNGPAVCFSNGENGFEKWYQNDKLHRVGAPAIEHQDGRWEWYENHEHHRLDGPALMSDDNKPLYRIMGKIFSEQEFPLGVERYLNGVEPTVVRDEDTFVGKQVAIIGKSAIDEFDINRVKGKGVKAVSRKADYAIIGSNAGKKSRQAEVLGIRTLTSIQAEEILNRDITKLSNLAR